MSNEQIILIPLTVDDLLSRVREIVLEVVKQNQEEKLQATLLSASEACQLFKPKISKATLHEWTKRGLIPVYRIGGRIFYKYSEVIDSAKRLRKFDRNKHYLL